MEAIIIALITAFNFLIIKWKIEKKRYEDAFFDVIILMILAASLQGSLGGMVITSLSSFFISIYFLISPPRFLSWMKFSDYKKEDYDNFFEEFKKRLPK